MGIYGSRLVDGFILLLIYYSHHTYEFFSNPRYTAMSSNPTKINDYNPIPTSPPHIHLTPATLPPLTHLHTPPTTPKQNPKPILKTRTSTTPISPISLNFSPPQIPADPHNPHPSLQYPLTRHLALLHPQTPGDIVNFCAIRLLSTDRPFGHRGDWVPIWKEDNGVRIDLSTAGIGMDAPKGYGRKAGACRGEEVDRRLEGMYAAARESWGLLEIKGSVDGNTSSCEGQNS
jgi:hypothetical protein